MVTPSFSPSPTTILLATSTKAVSKGCFRLDLPTATEPVSETLRMTGEAISSSASLADGPVMTVSTPGGRPASTSASAMAKHEPGVSEAGRATTEQPAASAAAILREGRRAGKFHADSDRQTPIG